MKIYHYLAGLLAVLFLAAAAFAADAPKETPEATATRVRELEKANVVLHEDLARTRLQLDLTREALAKTHTELDAEATARKALEERLASAQQQTARDITSNSDTVKKELTDAMQLKLAELAKQIDALSTRHDAELAAVKKSYDLKVASLQEALDKETAARAALEKDTGLQLTRLDKQQRKDRTWGFVMNGLTLGLNIMK